MTLPNVRTRSKVLAGLAFAVAATVVVSGQVPGGLPSLTEQILAAVRGLQGSSAAVGTSLEALQSDVDGLTSGLEGLQESVDALAPPAQSKVLTTPSALIKTGVIDCMATNVSDQTRTVRIELMNPLTGAAVFSLQPIIGAGMSSSAGAFPNVVPGRASCRFTVLDEDGTKTDIRANLVIGASLSDDTTLMSITAE